MKQQLLSTLSEAIRESLDSSHLRELRHHKKVFEAFQNSFLKNGIIVSIQCLRKTIKNFIYVLQQNAEDDRCLKKAKILASSKLLSLHHIKFLIPTARRFFFSNKFQFLIKSFDRIFPEVD